MRNVSDMIYKQRIINWVNHIDDFEKLSLLFFFIAGIMNDDLETGSS